MRNRTFLAIFLFVTISTIAMEQATPSIYEDPSLTKELGIIERASKQIKIEPQPWSALIFYSVPSLKECAIKAINKPLIQQFIDLTSSQETSLVCKDWIEKIAQKNLPEEILNPLFSNILTKTKVMNYKHETKKEELCDLLLKDSNKEIQYALLGQIAKYVYSFSIGRSDPKSISKIQKICSYAQEHKLSINLQEVEATLFQKVFEEGTRKNQSNLCQYLITNGANLKNSTAIWQHSIRFGNSNLIDFLIEQKMVIHNWPAMLESLNMLLQNNSIMGEQITSKVIQYGGYQLTKYDDGKKPHYLISKNKVDDEQFKQVLKNARSSNLFSITQDAQAELFPSQKKPSEKQPKSRTRLFNN